MEDRAPLLANVLSDPRDDTARLVLADWLEEHGEEDFGRFLRAGVLAAQFQAQDRLDDPAYYDLLRAVSEVTLTGLPARWLSALGIGPSPLAAPDWVWDHAGDRVAIRLGTATGVFTRGLLSDLIVPLAGSDVVTARALADWPLERTTIADAPGLSFWIEPPGDDGPRWHLTAAITAQPPRPRPRTVMGRFAALFGREDNPRPVPVGRWTARRAFADRAELVRSARQVWPVLFDEVREAAGAGWAVIPPQT